MNSKPPWATYREYFENKARVGYLAQPVKPPAAAFGILAPSLGSTLEKKNPFLQVVTNVQIFHVYVLQWIPRPGFSLAFCVLQAANFLFVFRKQGFSV